MLNLSLFAIVWAVRGGATVFGGSHFIYLLPLYCFDKMKVIFDILLSALAVSARYLDWFMVIFVEHILAILARDIHQYFCYERERELINERKQGHEHNVAWVKPFRQNFWQKKQDEESFIMAYNVILRSSRLTKAFCLLFTAYWCKGFAYCLLT